MCDSTLRQQHSQNCEVKIFLATAKIETIENWHGLYSISVYYVQFNWAMWQIIDELFKIQWN